MFLLPCKAADDKGKGSMPQFSRKKQNWAIIFLNLVNANAQLTSANSK